MHYPDANLDPTAVALSDATRLLTAFFQSGVTVKMLEADIVAGPPKRRSFAEMQQEAFRRQGLRR